MKGENAGLSIKSSRIMHGNINWLLSSDIRIKSGPNKGALYGWKNLNPPSFPFIYSEITGYAITCFTWLSSEFGTSKALYYAKEASHWIVRNLHDGLLIAKPPIKANDSSSSGLLYSFDNGMIMIGLLNLYKRTREKHLLVLAENVADALIKHFFDGEKLTARLDKLYQPLTVDYEDGIVKWSTISGAYHCKLAIGLLELSELTNNITYEKMSNSLCSYALRLQKSNGRFITNPGSKISYMHPHLYACEGLIYSGLRESNDAHYNAGIKGIKWGMEQLSSKNKQALCRDNTRNSVEQSDATAQLLRLLVLSHSRLSRYIKPSDLDKTVDRLTARLLDFYISSAEGQGAMRYQFGLDSACSWCTMFSIQALSLWINKKSANMWIDFFV